MNNNVQNPPKMVPPNYRSIYMEVVNSVLGGFSAAEIDEIGEMLGAGTGESLGRSTPTKAWTVATYASQNQKLDTLYELMRMRKASIPSFSDAYTHYVQQVGNYAGIAVPQLQEELNQLKLQLDEYKSQNVGKDDGLNNVFERVDRVIATSNGLLARVILPCQEELSIQLVPAHLLYRLEEYRSDSGTYVIFLGVVSGAIAGIIVNWATAGLTAISLSSILLLIVLCIFDSLGVLQVLKINARANEVKQRMFTPQPPDPNTKIGHDGKG
jgi:hypothetical protein